MCMLLGMVLALALAAVVVGGGHVIVKCWAARPVMDMTRAVGKVGIMVCGAWTQAWTGAIDTAKVQQGWAPPCCGGPGARVSVAAVDGSSSMRVHTVFNIVCAGCVRSSRQYASTCGAQGADQEAGQGGGVRVRM